MPNMRSKFSESERKLLPFVLPFALRRARPACADRVGKHLLRHGERIGKAVFLLELEREDEMHHVHPFERLSALLLVEFAEFDLVLCRDFRQYGDIPLPDRAILFSVRADGEEALKRFEQGNVDLILTDVMMPVMSGYTLAEILRSRGETVPIIMLTAKDAMSDKCRGFSAGTDDYMTKPVNFEDLVWRIDALLRRSRIANEGKITIGDVVIDKETYSVTRKGETVELPSKEFQLLFLLLSYPNKILTKEDILDSVWGYYSESDENTVRTHINRLRNKFESYPEFEIVTLRGIGYKAVIKK